MPSKNATGGYFWRRRQKHGLFKMIVGWVEQYWGATKLIYHSTPKTHGMEEIVRNTLDSVSRSQIYQCLRTVWLVQKQPGQKISWQSYFASRNGFKAQKRRTEWSMKVQIILYNFFVIFNELQVRCSKKNFFFGEPVAWRWLLLFSKAKYSNVQAFKNFQASRKFKFWTQVTVLLGFSPVFSSCEFTNQH